MSRKAAKQLRDRRRSAAAARLFERAALAHRDGNLAQAERLYRETIEQQPEHGPALHFLALLVQQTGEAREALVLLERACALDGADAPAWNNLGSLYRERERWPEAAAAYREALARSPNHLNALCNLAAVEQELGTHESAAGLYRRALEVAPRDAEAWHGLGISLVELGDAQGAEAAFEKALAAEERLALAWYNLGNLRKDRGEHEAALEAYRRAVRLEPGLAEAHNNLGNLLREAERFEEAIESFRVSLAHRPEHAETLHNLASTLVLAGDLDAARGTYGRVLALRPDDAELHASLGEMEFMAEEYVSAEAAYRRALALDPRSAKAHSGLGKTLVRLYRAAEAERECREALALDPELPDAYLNLGAALKFQHRVHEAIDAYEAAIRLDPAFPEAHNNLGLAYIDKGEFGKATRCYERALAINPEMPEVLVNFAHFKRYTSEDMSEIRKLEAILDDRGLRKETLSAVHFALGKAYDDCREYDRAFGHYTEGNEIRGEKRRFNRERHIMAVTKSIESFPPERFEHMAGYGDPSELPIFIVGMPRSGTTLAEQIIASHPLVHGADELVNVTEISKRISREAGSSAPYPESVPSLDAATVRRLAAEYLTFLHSLSTDALRITDKMPSNFLHLGLIAILFPNARVVHCRRDPRDVCLSNYFQLYGQGQHFSYRLNDLASYYREYERLMAHWRAVLPIRLHEVRYEALVADQEAESRRLVEFCGLAWDERCLQFHETRRTVQTASHWQVRQPLYARSAARWRHYEHLLPDEVKALAGAEAEP